MIAKSRGRPKGSKNKAKEQPETHDITQLMISMNNFIDKQTPKAFLEQFRMIRQETRSTDEAMKAIDGFKCDFPNWDSEQEYLHELWAQIKRQHRIESKTKEDECTEAINDVSEMHYEDEEEDSVEENYAIIDAIKATREGYLKWKPAKETLCEDGLSELPEDKQQILAEHWNDIFNENITYQEQIEKVILLIYDPTRGSHSGALNIGKLFGISRGAMQTHITRLFDGLRNESIGRPSIISEEQMQLMVHHIQKCLVDSHSPDLHALQNWIYKKFSIDVSTNTLAHIVSNSKTMKICPGIPMEQIRAEVPLEIIIQHYEKLQSFLENANIPPQFVFNVDESGFQAFVDAVTIPVIVPYDYNGNTAVFGVDRNTKRASLIGCIAADGSALKPMIIVPRKRLAANLKHYGYSEDVCGIISQESGFVNAAIFDYWATSVFFPEVQNRRLKYNYDGEVLLLLDGCSSHFSEFFLDECTFFDVYPWQEPAGTSDQIQPLDLGIFGAQKTLKRGIEPPEELGECERETIKIVDSWRRATTPENVTSAFRQAGIYMTISEDGREVVHADIKFARNVRGMNHFPAPVPQENIKTLKLKEF